MTPTLGQAFEEALAEGLALLRSGRLDAAEQALARAHILGQYHVLPHVRSHWWLLVVELRRRRPLAVAGQFARIVLGALGSALNVVPDGNPGTSDVSMLARHPVPPALRELMTRH